MRRIFVEDDADNSGEVSITLVFDGRSTEEVAEACAMMQASRMMAPIGTRLGIEIDAHVAYFQALEAGMRGLLIEASPTGGPAK